MFQLTLENKRRARDKDLKWTAGISSISKKIIMLGSHPPHSRAAVVCSEENYIRGERISIVFFRLRSVVACRALQTCSVLKIASEMGLTRSLVRTFPSVSDLKLFFNRLPLTCLFVYSVSSRQINSATISNYLCFPRNSSVAAKTAKDGNFRARCYSNSSSEASSNKLPGNAVPAVT